MDAASGAGWNEEEIKFENRRERMAALEEELRQLQAEIGECSGQQAQRHERKKLEADIEFIGDFDIVAASGVDISAGGICFEVSHPLPFDMKISIGGEKHIYRAYLVWVKSTGGDNYRLGFEFISPETNTEF